MQRREYPIKDYAPIANCETAGLIMKHSLICTADAGRQISGSKSNRQGPRLEGIFPLPGASHSGLLRWERRTPMNCRRLFRSVASGHDFNTR